MTGDGAAAHTSTWRALQPDQRRRVLASLASLALLFFDQTAVVVALPAIRQEFGASYNATAWTVTVYLLALAVFMPAVGRVADRFGRRKVLVTALVLFGVGSAACAVAPSIGLLIAFRLIQGIAGAVMQPMALSVGVRDVPADHRGRVIGLMSTGGSSLLVFGPLIASGLLSVGSWRLLFVVNLPVVLYVVVEMARNGPITTARGTSFPVRSTIWLLLALSATVLGISQLASWGLVAVGVLVVGLVLLGGFVRSEHRRQDPLLPVAYLRDRGLTGSLIALFAIQFAVLAMMVSLVGFLEVGVGVTAAAAGLVVAVTGMGSPLLSITTGRLADTHGVRRLVIPGLVAVTVGLVLTGAAAHTLSILWLVPGLVLFGVSRPAVFTPASSGAMAAIPDEDRPVAASLVTEARQLGAVMGASVAGVAADFAGRLTPQDAVEGFAAAIWVTAAVTALAGVMAVRLLPKAGRRAV